ncbi:MAG: lipocalin family protein [Halarcobacter sp.]
MKLIFTTIFILSMLIANTSFDDIKAPKPVDYVDAKSFSGLWYEIARTENSFEKNCVGATVEYTLTQKLEYEVKNRCFNKVFNGNIIEYNGVAKASNGNIMSQIDMTYFWIFTKQYRIIYLSKDYSTAVMVDNDMEYVWVMNRKPFMKKENLDNIVSFLSNYMDTKELIFTPQNPKGKKNND